MKISPRQFLRSLLAASPPRIQARVSAWRSRGQAKLGAHAYLHHSVQVLGLQQLSVGDNTVISQDTWLNVNHREVPGAGIEIGANCFIGRRNFFSSGAGIQIGPFVLTANDCHFLGSSHIINDPLRACITTGTTCNDRIYVGANTFFGSGARVLGTVSIGHGCVVGADSLVTRNMPPFSQLYGSPARVHQRYSFPRSAWVPIEEFSPADENAILLEGDLICRLNAAKRPVMPYLAAGNDMGNC